MKKIIAMALVLITLSACAPWFDHPHHPGGGGGGAPHHAVAPRP